MQCVFHSADLDGKSSAAIIKNKFPFCELVPYDYGKVFPWDRFNNPEEDVYMVDISLPIEDMIALSKLCHLTWIDHHKTAIDDAEQFNFNPKGIRKVGVAACELVWQYIHTSNVPKTIKYLGRYDVWDHSDPNTLIFQHGMRIRNTSPSNSELWHSILFPVSNSEIDKILRDGNTILEFVKNENKVYANGYAFETEFEGYRAIAINKGMTNSKIFDHVWDPEKHDIMIAFCMTKENKWKISLYTEKDNIDVGKIAKNLGEKYKTSGGGHEKASGFLCNELPFTMRQNNA